MATFKYTLPSGATFTMNAPTGTTQAAADKIFYEQVAAGTFVGYKPGDTLTHPAEALTNFGLSRLQRGTADVNDQALLAITAGLPVVTPLPTTLSSIPIQNVINQTNFIQVNSNPIDGLFTQGPSAIAHATVVAHLHQLDFEVGRGGHIVTQDKGGGGKDQAE